MTLAQQVRARERLKRQVSEWAERMGVKPARVQVQEMRIKWASCSNSGRLCFSTRLLRQPAAFREQVVVHELLHLKVPNHGRLFRALLRSYLARDWDQSTQFGGRIAHGRADASRCRLVARNGKAPS